MRTFLGVVALLLLSGCTSGTESEPPPSTPQASPDPNASESAAGPADTAPQGRWRIVVSSDSPYYPGGTSRQDVTLRILCPEECVGTLETESGVIRTVRWDGDSLVVELPDEEDGPAQCFDAEQQPVSGSATMTVHRTADLRLASSDPDADGRPTRLEGAYDEAVAIDEESAGCGFPDTFDGTWSWVLTALDSSPAAGDA